MTSTHRADSCLAQIAQLAQPPDPPLSGVDPLVMKAIVAVRMHGHVCRSGAVFAMSHPLVPKVSAFAIDPQTRARSRQRGCLLLVTLVALAGCRSSDKSAPWSPPTLAPVTLSPATRSLTARWGQPDGPAPATPAPAPVIQQASLDFPKHP